MTKKAFNFRNFFTIRTKLVFVIVLLVVLTITATKVYDYSVRVPELEKAMKENQLDIAVLTASQLETELAKTVATLEASALNPVFISNNEEAIINQLLSIKAQNDIFSSVFMVDASLNRVNEKGERTSLADREYMQEVKKTQQTIVSREILISQATNKPSIMVATPIKISGSPESYLGISVSIDHLQAIVNAASKSGTNYAFAFDGKDGLVFAHPKQEYIGSLKLINPDEKDIQTVAPELREMAQIATTGQSGTQIYNFNGVKTIAAYASVPGSSYGVASRMSYEEAMEPVRQEWNSAAIIATLASIFSIIAALIFAKWIADPIKQIARQANIIASGDFTQAKHIVVKSNDEIGQLQKAFKDMAIMLNSVMEQIGKAANHIASLSGSLEAGAEQSAQGATQVAETVGEVAAGAVNQVEDINNTVKIVKDMGNEINDIAHNASGVVDLAESTATAAQNGGKAIRRTVDSITEINHMVQDTAHVIRGLGDFSQKISQIVDAISGIASQTNLLALNAAIEAARAGEQGRGFSVVADEVRKLAGQSEESAGNIARIITEIQSQIKYAVEKMDQSAEEVVKGQGIARAAGEAFETIQSQIDNVNQAVQGIREVVGLLSESSSNVVISVEEIRDISHETAAHSQTISAATEEQSAGMQEVAASAESLARLSGELEKILQQYKF